MQCYLSCKNCEHGRQKVTDSYGTDQQFHFHLRIGRGAQKETGKLNKKQKWVLPKDGNSTSSSTFMELIGNQSALLGGNIGSTIGRDTAKDKYAANHETTSP